MHRPILALALLAVGPLASSQIGRNSPQRAPIARRATKATLRRPIQISANVRASLERPHAELRAAATKGLNGSQRARLQGVIGDLKRGQKATAQARWRAFMAEVHGGGIPVDIDALVQYVIRQSYLETNNDLKFYADKVRHCNEMKKAIRDHLAEVRKLHLEWVRQAPSQGIDPEQGPTSSHPPVLRRLILPQPQTPPIGLVSRQRATGTRAALRKPNRPEARSAPGRPTYQPWTVVSKAEWETYIQTWEQRLRTIGDDAQLANIDLQSALQRQQQTMQMMSQVSKQLHDTALAVTRKMGG